MFADRIPSPRRLDRDEALAELALRYFTGHGPATERDLAYWATLTLGDVRAGLAQATDRLDSFEHDGRTFWHAPADPPATGGSPAGHLLQILDETYRGYQDSRWVLDAAGIVPRTREATAGMALVDAQLVAAMKRTVTADQVPSTCVRTARFWPPTWRTWRRRPAGTARSSAAPRRSSCDDPSVASSQRFSTHLVSGSRNRVFVPVPFDPDHVWGPKREHHVHGSVNGMGVRGVIEPLADGRASCSARRGVGTGARRG